MVVSKIAKKAENVPEIPFQLNIKGMDADRHELPAYDGFTGLAGFSLALSIVTHYVATGKMRRRGAFEGRNEVKAQVARPGSVDQAFIVHLISNPLLLESAGAVGTGIAANFLYDIFKRTLNRNIGVETEPETTPLQHLEEKKLGDLEALASATEAAFRQAHVIIGNGATQINIYGGKNKISQFNQNTKDYVNFSIEDKEIIEKDVSVAAFNANSGVGRVYDKDYGRTFPIYLTKETFDTARPVLGWGLNEYSKGTGKLISLRYRRTLAFDGTPKRYIVLDAAIPGQ